MAQQLVIPKFASESEEAQWWFDNQDLAFEEFVRADKEGRVERGMAARLAREASAAALTIALDPEDAERARAQAQRRGMDYREYVKTVVHRALMVEETGA